MKKAVFALITILSAFAQSAWADTFSLSVPASTEVVMQDAQASVPVTVTNNGPSRDIRSVTFNIDTSKYAFSATTVPPAGWCIDSISDGSIRLALVQSGGGCGSNHTESRIPPGDSLVFVLKLLPAAAPWDSTDTFTSVAVTSQTGFTLSGALPSWTRRSLEASIAASPESVGIGDDIILIMDVVNRSTSPKSAIASEPAPPAASAPIASLVEGPYYATALLTAALSSSATVVQLSSTAGFPASGTVRIGTEDICYSAKTATTLTGALRGCNSTVAASHPSEAAVYGMDAVSLAPGAGGQITWIYRADSGGTLGFSTRAVETTGGGRSALAVSNEVIIGDFTASLGLSPASVIDAQTVTVTMAVFNNGSAALVNVAPTLLAGCPGGAAETRLTGPTPATIPSLAPGSSGVFSWTYRITGSVGQQYCLTGGATANGPVATNQASTETGVISNYSVTLAPSVITSGAMNATFTWTVYNGSGCGIRGIEIERPATGWTCANTSAPAGWNDSCGQPVAFDSTRSRYDIEPDSTGSFTITFGSTESISVDKVVPFPVAIASRSCGGTVVTLGSYITVSASAIALSSTPAGPVYADGSSYYTVTATLTSGAAPLAGRTVSFSTTNGSLESTTAVTDANGQATVRLFSPSSTTNTIATVTADYSGASASTALSFLGWNKANIQYWGGLSPATLDCGENETVTMDLRNTGAVPMNLTTASYFALNDATAGGTSVFKAYLSTPLSIPAGATRQASFGAATASGGIGGALLTSAFLAGSYQPLSNSSPPPESGLFLTDGGANDQYRGVTENVTVAGGCGIVRVRVLDWHEMR